MRVDPLPMNVPMYTEVHISFLKWRIETSGILFCETMLQSNFTMTCTPMVNTYFYRGDTQLNLIKITTVT